MLGSDFSHLRLRLGLGLGLGNMVRVGFRVRFRVKLWGYG